MFAALICEYGRSVPNTSWLTNDELEISTRVDQPGNAGNSGSGIVRLASVRLCRHDNAGG